MFERFSERGRQVVVLAQDESRSLGHGFIGTEHLLLGVLREGGSASAALISAGLSLEEARATVVSLIGSGEAPVSGQIPFTPQAKSALEAALRQAVQRSAGEITPSLVLLGVLMQRSDTAACVVRDSGTNVAEFAASLDVPGEVEVESITPTQDAKPERLLGEAWSVFEMATTTHPWVTSGRLTERAREVMALAQEEARYLHHGYIGTEHILLGLMHDEAGLAARVLSALELTIEDTRTKIVAVVGEGEGEVEGTLPLTPRSKSVLDLAMREALSLGRNYVDGEHMLLALVRVNEGVAARVLLDFDVDSATVRERVIKLLSSPRPRPSNGSPSAGNRRDGQTWEYRIEVWEGADLRNHIDQLNELGLDGWQLATALPELPAERKFSGASTVEPWHSRELSADGADRS